jgi:hypothetical protein
MKWTMQKKVGVGIVAVGLGPLLTVIFIGLAYNPTPLDTPMQLKIGDFRSPEFKTHAGVIYYLSIVGDGVEEEGAFAGPALSKEWCMMGIKADPIPLNCDGVEQSVDFDWQLISRQGQIIESGSYKPINFGNLHVEFAEFQGNGNGGRVTLSIHQDGRELNGHHLRLDVGQVHESDFPLVLPYLLLMSGGWALIVVIIGLLLILLPPLRLKGLPFYLN